MSRPEHTPTSTSPQLLVWGSPFPRTKPKRAIPFPSISLTSLLEGSKGCTMSERSLVVEDLIMMREEAAAARTCSSRDLLRLEEVSGHAENNHNNNHNHHYNNASSRSRMMMSRDASLRSAICQSSLRNLVHYGASPLASDQEDEHGVDDSSELPNDVCTVEDADKLPKEYRSGDTKRPLKATDAASGDEYHYALRPLLYSASFVLLLHLAEGIATYGTEGIITPFLVGSYDASWNANFTSVTATSYVSGVASVASIVPFVGGIVADGYLGDYWTLLAGAGLFYLPGLLLITLTTVPFLLGSTFNYAALSTALLGLCPIGAGLVKTVTSVYGAKQFHPVLQSSMIESYYVYYFQVLNVGALGGGIVIPLLAQWNDTAAFLFPAAILAIGVAAFVAGTRRYVTMKPQRDALSKTLQVVNCCPRLPRSRASTRAAHQLVRVVAVSSLKIPFDIAYCQMTTVFSVQALAMRPVGFIDAAMMLNANALVSLLFGVVLSTWLYPALHRRGIRLGITHKFAIGTVLAAGAVLAAIFVDYAIHDAIANGADKISILWQTVNYAFIGIGELFVVTTCFEAAFVIAPKDQKGLSSAINLFMLSGFPNFLSIGLYNGFSSWFPSGSPADTYGTSQVYKYLWLLFGFTVAGTVLVLLPPVTKWVDSIYEEALKSESASSDDFLYDCETEILFISDESSISSAEGNNNKDRREQKGDGRPEADDPYLTSANMSNYFVDLEMQDVLSVCDSDDHSYHPDSYTGSDTHGAADDTTAAKFHEGESGLFNPEHRLYSSSTHCDCASVSSLPSSEDDGDNNHLRLGDGLTGDDDDESFLVETIEI
jgi:proton-dependent oligopeptide transporter, POT family